MVRLIEEAVGFRPWFWETETTIPRLIYRLNTQAKKGPPKGGQGQLQKHKTQNTYAFTNTRSVGSLAIYSAGLPSLSELNSTALSSGVKDGCGWVT